MTLPLPGVWALAAWMATCGIPVLASTPDAQPANIVVIMADNLGAWQLGCYGNADVETPHLDSLAEGGLRFERAMCCNPVCSPTRASYLTGLIPSQHGVHHWLQDGDLQMGKDAKCVVAQYDTVPKLLGEAGYYCGHVGKWHLGGKCDAATWFQVLGDDAQWSDADIPQL